MVGRETSARSASSCWVHPRPDGLRAACPRGARQGFRSGATPYADHRVQPVSLTTYLREDRDSQATPPRRGQGRPPKATSYAAFLPDEDESTFIIGEPTKPPPKVA